MFGFFKKKDEPSKKVRKYKPAKVVGAGDPWKKKNEKNNRRDEKREARQMRTGNK